MGWLRVRNFSINIYKLIVSLKVLLSPSFTVFLGVLVCVCVGIYYVCIKYVFMWPLQSHLGGVPIILPLQLQLLALLSSSFQVISLMLLFVWFLPVFFFLYPFFFFLHPLFYLYYYWVMSFFFCYLFYNSFLCSIAAISSRTTTTITTMSWKNWSISYI